MKILVHVFRLCLVSLLVLWMGGCGWMASYQAKKVGVNNTAAGLSPSEVEALLGKCDEVLGTIVVDDGHNAEWYGQFNRVTKVTSIEPLLRLAIQKSNCFTIISVGDQKADLLQAAVSNKQNSDAAADYFLEPQIRVAGSPGSGIGLMGGLGGMYGSSAIAAIAGNVQTKSSIVTLNLYDARSSVLIAASEGRATTTSYGGTIAGFGNGVGALAGFSTTPEGKATVAAFVEAYNNIVMALRSYKAAGG